MNNAACKSLTSCYLWIFFIANSSLSLSYVKNFFLQDFVVFVSLLVNVSPDYGHHDPDCGGHDSGGSCEEKVPWNVDLERTVGPVFVPDDHHGAEDLGAISPSCLWAAFMHADPKSAKRCWWLDWIFTLLGSMQVKAFRKMLMKLTPGVTSRGRWWRCLLRIQPRPMDSGQIQYVKNIYWKYILNLKKSDKLHFNCNVFAIRTTIILPHFLEVQRKTE